MKTKLVSPRSELMVLRALTHRNKVISGSVRASIDDSFFSSPESKEILGSISKQMAETGEPPLYKLVISDPDISEEARSYFRDSEASIQTVEDATRAVKILNRYRQNRIMDEIKIGIDEAQHSGKVNIESLMETVSSKVSAARAAKSTESEFLHFGRNNSSLAEVKDLLWGDKSENVIPTGIDAFDSKSGGLLRGGLVTIGASSGGGKSLMACQLAINMANRGYKVVIVPLEMSRAEMTARLVANINKIDVTRILTGKLTDLEKDKAFARYKKWIRSLKAKGGRLTIYKPKDDVTIEDVFAAVSAYDCDVRIIDYISLLKGVDDDDAWQKLGSIARLAKVNAESTNCINILLCQVNDDGKIRYARAISEHCLAGDSLIDTEKGLVRIDSLYPEADVMSTKPLSGLRVKSEGHYRSASHVHFNGIRKVYQLVLEDGHSIRCTSQHQFRHLTLKGGINWERLKDLRVGDHVAVDHGASAFGEDFTVTVPQVDTHHNAISDLPAEITVDKHLGYVLGCLASDGHVAGGAIDFIASDYSIMERFVGCWRLAFPGAGFKVYSLKTPAGVPIWRFKRISHEVATFLYSISGMRGQASGKSVPEVVMKASEETVKAYIAGVFDGDGTCGKRSACLNSINGEQLRKIQILLGNIGIRAFTKEHRLQVSGSNYKEFIRLIPIVKTKRTRIGDVGESRGDVVPAFVFSKILEDQLSCTSPRMKQRTEKIRALRGDLIDAGISIGRQKVGPLRYECVSDVQEILQETDLHDQLTEVRNFMDTMRFRKIVEILEIGSEKVYDLTVPGTNNYVANGIVTHNSNNSFIWVTKKEEREKNIGRIRVEQPKARNSAAYPFEVGFEWAHMRVVDIESMPDTSSDSKESLANLADA